MFKNTSYGITQRADTDFRYERKAGSSRIAKKCLEVGSHI